MMRAGGGGEKIYKGGFRQTGGGQSFPAGPTPIIWNITTLDQCSALQPGGTLFVFPLWIKAVEFVFSMEGSFKVGAYNLSLTATNDGGGSSNIFENPASFVGGAGDPAGSVNPQTMGSTGLIILSEIAGTETLKRTWHIDATQTAVGNITAADFTWMTYKAYK